MGEERERKRERERVKKTIMGIKKQSNRERIICFIDSLRCYL